MYVRQGGNQFVDGHLALVDTVRDADAAVAGCRSHRGRAADAASMASTRSRWPTSYWGLERCQRKMRWKSGSTLMPMIERSSCWTIFEQQIVVMLHHLWPARAAEEGTHEHVALGARWSELGRRDGNGVDVAALAARDDQHRIRCRAGRSRSV